MAKAFISYTHSDEEAARRLTEELEARGVHVWRIDRSVAPGESWVGRVEQAISECDLFFVMVSPASDKSQWLATETALALSRSAEGRTVVIPVLLDRRSKPPDLLQSTQGIELFDHERSRRQLNALVKTIDSGALPTRGQLSRDLDAQAIRLRANREALDKEIDLYVSRRAIWSSTIVAAVTALATLVGLSAALLSVSGLLESKVHMAESWPLPFVLGVLASVAASLVFELLRRRFMRRGSVSEPE